MAAYTRNGASAHCQKLLQSPVVYKKAKPSAKQSAETIPLMTHGCEKSSLSGAAPIGGGICVETSDTSNLDTGIHFGKTAILAAVNAISKNYEMVVFRAAS